VERAPLLVRLAPFREARPTCRAVRAARGPVGPCTPLQLEGRSLLTVNGSNAKLQGLKVLVIDDSKTIRRTAETLLAKEGCEVFTAIDGFDALAKIADHQPDIVFVDIMMPRLDGYQTCSLIKHNKVFRSIPVIMLSSKDGLFDRARGRIVGSEHYLTKPFTKDELLSAIETHIGR
jgi:twitching motility two-component system response regulator PilG